MSRNTASHGFSNLRYLRFAPLGDLANHLTEIRPALSAPVRAPTKQDVPDEAVEASWSITRRGDLAHCFLGDSGIETNDSRDSMMSSVIFRWLDGRSCVPAPLESVSEVAVTA